MATTQTNSTKKMKYKAIDDFDVNKLPAELPAGAWRVKIKKCQARATKKQDPMLSITYEVIEAKDPDQESLVGKTVDELVIFYSDKDVERSRASKMNKVRLRQICENANIELDSIPSKISATGEELEEFSEILKGVELDIWTSVRKEESGEERTQVFYTEPGGMSLAGTSDDEDEEPKTKAKAKKGARR